MDGLYLSIQPQAPDFPCDVRGGPGFESFPGPDGGEYGFGVRLGSHYRLHVHGVGSFLFRQGAFDVTGFPESGVDLCSFREAFLHGVAPWLLQRGPWDCLHASAVFDGKGVLVFCGPSGAGKSTLSGAWVREGATLYGDDALPFLVSAEAVLAARLPQRLRLRGSARRLLKDVADPLEEISTAGHEMRVSLAGTLRPIRAIFCMGPMLPRSAPEPALISRLSPHEAFPLLLAAAHCMSMTDPDCNRKMVNNYLALSRLAPAFRLAVAADLQRLDGVVGSIRKELAALTAGA